MRYVLLLLTTYTNSKFHPVSYPCSQGLPTGHIVIILSSSPGTRLSLQPGLSEPFFFHPWIDVLGGPLRITEYWFHGGDAVEP